MFYCAELTQSKDLDVLNFIWKTLLRYLPVIYMMTDYLQAIDDEKVAGQHLMFFVVTLIFIIASLYTCKIWSSSQTTHRCRHYGSELPT